jgi:hypothetical protein
MVAALIVACSHRPSACQAPSDCGEGHECLAFRCEPRGKDPVPPEGERLVVTPIRLGASAARATSHDVALGPPEHVELYAAFDFPKLPCSNLDSAFLLLDASDPAQSPPQPVQVLVRRVRQPWTARDLEQGELPEDGLPEARGFVRPPVVGRIDVTALVCNALDNGVRDHGLVVKSLDDSVPLRIATGLGERPPPRIEMYFDEARSPESNRSPDEK